MFNDNTGRDRFQTLFGVSRETLERLDIYHGELVRWTERINLISRASVAEIWQRHFADSAQLLTLADGHKGLWADFGAGAGFPGLVIAAMDPARQITLVESDQRKCAFLLNTAQKMGLSVNVVAQRIEEIPPLKALVISARALAALDQLLTYAERHLAKGGICVFPKGIQAESELTAARKAWHIECDLVPSQSDPNATILKIREFARVPA
ncbi:MAG: 16S rRNA (guanine(527)-N(7))-methyltransferase RsmG [Paracoccaceae bacterium]